MSELDDTREDRARRRDRTPDDDDRPDVAGEDAGGEVARSIRAVLRHGLEGGQADGRR